MEKSESIGALAAALAKAQGEIKGAVRDSDNPFFKSKYADLASVWEACRAPLAKNGLSVIQTCRSAFDEQGEHLFVDTMLAHSSGEWIMDSCEAVVAKPDAQGYGSAITYFRRYGLSAIVGVAPLDDDDGEAAVGRTQGVQQTTRKPRQPKPKAGGAVAPPDDTPAHIANARQALNNLCLQIAGNGGDEPLSDIRKDTWASLCSEFEITKLDDIDEKTASQIIDWCQSKLEEAQA